MSKDKNIETNKKQIFGNHTFNSIKTANFDQYQKNQKSQFTSQSGSVTKNLSRSREIQFFGKKGGLNQSAIIRQRSLANPKIKMIEKPVPQKLKKMETIGDESSSKRLISSPGGSTSKLNRANLSNLNMSKALNTSIFAKMQKGNPNHNSFSGLKNQSMLIESLRAKGTLSPPLKNGDLGVNNILSELDEQGDLSDSLSLSNKGNDENSKRDDEKVPLGSNRDLLPPIKTSENDQKGKDIEQLFRAIRKIEPLKKVLPQKKTQQFFDNLSESSSSSSLTYDSLRDSVGLIPVIKKEKPFANISFLEKGKRQRASLMLGVRTLLKNSQQQNNFSARGSILYQATNKGEFMNMKAKVILRKQEQAFTKKQNFNLNK